MARRASGKRKKGRSVRRARAGLVGESVITSKREAQSQFSARIEKRREIAEDKREMKRLKELNLEKSAEGRDRKMPRSFVFHRGLVGKYILRLVKDLRRVMEPYTASNLKVLKRNNIKDFVAIAAPLGVSHLIVLTRSDNSVNLRIVRLPHGPTIYFKVSEYSLCKHILSTLKRHVVFGEQFTNQPLVVMNNFNAVSSTSNSSSTTSNSSSNLTSSNDEPQSNRHLNLVQTMFRNMFPPINVDTIDLSKVRRCVLLNYNEESGLIDFRHYAIKAVAAGLSKSTKKLVRNKTPPDLSKYADISDYFLNPGQLSESEYEMDQKEVELSQDLTTRGCKKGQQTNIRLYELGPRLSLDIVKIVEGLDDGQVLYHSYMKKSAADLAKLRQQLPAKKKQKLRREKSEEYRIVRKLEAINERKKAQEHKLNEQKRQHLDRQLTVTGVNQNDDDHHDGPVREKTISSASTNAGVAKSANIQGQNTRNTGNRKRVSTKSGKMAAGKKRKAKS